MRARSFALSFVLQILGVLLLLAVPILKPEVLPKGLAHIVGIAAPPGRPPAPPPPESRSVARPAAPRLFAGGILTVPGRITGLKTIIDDTELPPAPPGIQGAFGAPDPGPGGLVNEIMRYRLATPPPPPAPAPIAAPAAKEHPRLKVGGNVQEALIVHRVTPVYPPLARQTRVSGTVRFTAIIGRDGTIQGLTLVGGHPWLVQTATEAVRQWRYRPTFLNGDPVEVITTIEVRFVLN